MFDVSKIRLGDYVETRDGRIGYVVENKWSIGENRFAVQFNNGDIYSFLVCTLTNKYFKQIGSYKFDENKGEKKPKIKPLTYTEINCVDIYSGKTFSGYKDLPREIEVVQKINKIIDYLNKECYNNGTK